MARAAGPSARNSIVPTEFSAFSSIALSPNLRASSIACSPQAYVSSTSSLFIPSEAMFA